MSTLFGFVFGAVLGYGTILLAALSLLADSGQDPGKHAPPFRPTKS